MRCVGGIPGAITLIRKLCVLLGSNARPQAFITDLYMHSAVLLYSKRGVGFRHPWIESWADKQIKVTYVIPLISSESGHDSQPQSDFFSFLHCILIRSHSPLAVPGHLESQQMQINSRPWVSTSLQWFLPWRVKPYHFNLFFFLRTQVISVIISPFCECISRASPSTTASVFRRLLSLWCSCSLVIVPVKSHLGMAFLRTEDSRARSWCALGRFIFKASDL